MPGWSEAKKGQCKVVPESVELVDTDLVDILTLSLGQPGTQEAAEGEVGLVLVMIMESDVSFPPFRTLLIPVPMLINILGAPK